MILIKIEIDLCRLTTIDNPWNPIDNYSDWYHYDVDILGHNTCGVLARLDDLYPTTEDMTISEVNAQNEKAIDALILADVLGFYKKVKKKVTIELDDEEDDTVIS